jgi:capsid protein
MNFLKKLFPRLTKPVPNAMVTAFEAARRSGYRGYFYFPNLNPAAQAPSGTRLDMAKKAVWLDNNVPEVNVLTNNISQAEAGRGMWPKAVTSSADFNREITEAFHQDNKDPRVCDARAVDNFYSAQFSIRRHIRLHGAIFAALVRPSPGSHRASFYLIPDWQVDNAQINEPQDKWRDGVWLNDTGRALKYRVLRNPERTSFSDYSASDLLHLHDPFLAGQIRGVSSLHSVIRKIFSMDDIDRAATSGMLLRERIAYAITKNDSESGFGSLLPGATGSAEVSTDSGKMIVQQIVSNQGDDIDVADLPVGTDIKVIESNRATPASSFTESMLRSIAHSTPYPAEWVYFLSNLGQGTVARLVMDRVQDTIDTIRENQLQSQFCERYYTFWLWQKIKHGGVTAPVPYDWWKVKWIHPRKASVDRGREGRLYDDRVASGKMTPSAYHGLEGEDDEDVEDENLRVVERRLQKLAALNTKTGQSLTYEQLWPRTTSAPSPAADDDLASV